MALEEFEKLSSSNKFIEANHVLKARDIVVRCNPKLESAEKSVLYRAITKRLQKEGQAEYSAARVGECFAFMQKFIPSDYIQISNLDTVKNNYKKDLADKKVEQAKKKAAAKKEQEEADKKSEQAKKKYESLVQKQKIKKIAFYSAIAATVLALGGISATLSILSSLVLGLTTGTFLLLLVGGYFAYKFLSKKHQQSKAAKEATLKKEKEKSEEVQKTAQSAKEKAISAEQEAAEAEEKFTLEEKVLAGYKDETEIDKKMKSALNELQAIADTAKQKEDITKEQKQHVDDCYNYYALDLTNRSVSDTINETIIEDVILEAKNRLITISETDVFDVERITDNPIVSDMEKRRMADIAESLM